MLMTLQNWISDFSLPALLVVGIMILFAFYAGRGIRHLRLPTIIGFMLVGVLLGPSILSIISEDLRMQLDFITQIALGTVAVGIGLELSLKSLWHKGPGLVILIVTQLLTTFFIVAAGVYLLTRNIVPALVLGAIATATAPAGTAAVIQETNAQGPLTKALYAIVGLDDALGILIFGFAFAVARGLLASQLGDEVSASLFDTLLFPLIEISLSLVWGIATGVIFCLLLRAQSDRQAVLIQTFAMILITIGFSRLLPLSMIFTLLVAGSIVVNTQPSGLVERLRGELTGFTPLLYILFFALAGANLHLGAIPQIGLLGLVYILSRSAGKISGAWFGSVLGKLQENLKRYTGMALLSQAGIAIGLALIVKSEFRDYGAEGVRIGGIVLTTITASCIIFELIGPVLVKIALRKSGEIPLKK